VYSKEELKQLKKEFWEGFGIYCAEIPSMKRRKSKFMLYNTKMKGVELKFDASRDGAFVILEINHPDTVRRFELFEKFEQYKSIFEKSFTTGLIWDFEFTRDCGTEVCRIYSQKNGIDIHKRIQWMEFYKFMVDDMLKLEKAFKTVKDMIE